MGNDVKRYITCVELPTNLPDVVVGAADYAALEAECERLRVSLKDADAGMMLFLEQRDALAAELRALKGQEPVAWAPRTCLDKLRSGRNNSPTVLTDGPAEFNDTPLYAAPPAAQDVSALPPFAEKVLAKLRRFEECAEDSGSGGVDIGRHWLDLLTQLALLNRVQRSPGIWEISQQGEDFLDAHRQAQKQERHLPLCLRRNQDRRARP